MTRNKIAAIFLTVIALFTLVTPALAAPNMVHQEVALLPQGETIEGDYFATGEKVTIAGTVNGDVYAAGGNVIVEGTVNGDLLVAGGSVNIMGNVKNDVRAAGGEVIISGDIGGNVTTTAGAVNFTDSANIGGSVVNASGSFSLFAPVGKGITLASGDATIGNTVGSNITAGVGQLTLTSKAQVKGDVNYWSEKDAQIQQGAQVTGSTVKNVPQRQSQQDAEKALGAAFLIFKAISFLAALIIGLLFIKFLPNFTERTVDSVVERPLKNLGVGLLTLVVTPLAVVVLTITIVGIPIALALLVDFIFVLYLAKLFVAIAVGRIILRFAQGKENNYLALIAGLLIYGILTTIPVIGWLVTLFVVLIGSGALVSEKLNSYKLLRNKKVV
ncbi:MAG: FapA family protein [Candidatus Curtissbacteria bacterium]|nr:FapA family protein [Candidatus Curtissbacteria bacterium]